MHSKAGSISDVVSASAAGRSAGPSVLEPLALGRCTLSNRIVFGTHLTNFGKGNVFTERHIAYYQERAAGGAALVVTEALTVHPLDWPYEHVPFGHTEAIVPSLAALRAALHIANPDTRLLAQLNHTGGQCSGRLLRQSPWAPSPMTDVASKRVAREMLGAEVEQVLTGFASAATHVVRAGLDGVELNAGQSSLIRQFLSALTNHRQDEYGGDPERRQRFLMETVARVRKALGPEPILGVKLCGDELAPWGGLTPDDAAMIGVRLAATNQVDYLSVEIGGPYSTFVTDAAMPTPQGHAAHLAQRVRTALRDAGYGIPVFAEGRIESNAVAEGILQAHQADAVVMTRALISDPRLPRKVTSAQAVSLGRGGEPVDTEPVRPHVGHTRYYAVRGDWNRPLGDLANPRAGREASFPVAQPGPETSGRLVLVTGGGPAGCEAALTLARQGANVSLVEGAPELGGWANRLAKFVAARGEYAPLVAYYAAMLSRTGVRVNLGLPIRGDEGAIAGHAIGEYSRIYVAVGAEAPASDLRVESPTCPVLSARSLLDNSPLPSPGRAAVIDTECGFRMANAVEFLLAHGYTVEVVTPDLFVGRELVESGEFFWFQRVATAQTQGMPAVALRPRLQARVLREDRLTCVDRFSEEEISIGPLVLVVLAQPEIPATKLYETLAARHPSVVRIGDARAPRQMGEAILNAHRAVVLGASH